MAYNFNKIPNRRVPGVTNKWTLYSDDVIPMWVADMDFSAPPPVLKAVEKFAQHGDFGYQLPSPELYETIATRMDKLYNWKISPDMIVTVPGVNSGYNVAVRTFCTSRKGYLIQTPVYNEFIETHVKTGVPQVDAPLQEKVEGNRIEYEVDFEAFERAAKKANLFLLCDPHNPIGRIYSPDELQKMAAICNEHGVLVVSDEIHSELLLDGNTFQPMAALSPDVADRTITLVAASKGFNVPGLLCAFAIIPNAEIRKRYQETVYNMGLFITAPGLLAARVAYSGVCDPWLKALRKYLTQNRDFLVEYVTKYLPGVRVTVPDATYLAWLDFSELQLEPSPYEFFLKHARVALSDGKKFGTGSEQYARLNFGTSRKVLEKGLERMRNALKSN
jgi:cysteine-S-conjugate beta-lyase